jgi:replicative DNA helicase
MPRTATRTGGSPSANHADNLPPQNLEAEAATLGTFLIDGNGTVSDEIMQIVAPRHFYNDANGMIFSVFCDMRNANRPIDAMTAGAELDRRGQLAEIGGPGRLAELMEATPVTAHGAYYAKEVRDAARRRGLMTAGIDLARRARDKSIDTEELLADADNAVHAEMEDSLTSKPIDIGDVLRQEVIKTIRAGKPLQRTVSTGLDRVDAIIRYPAGGITTLAARPSMGKTAEAVSSGHAAAEDGASILFVSYEQQRSELAQRFLSISSGVSFHDLGKASTDESLCHTIMEAAGRLQKLKIQLDTSCRNQSGLCTLIRLAARRGVDLVFVDYLQLIEADDRRAVREQQVASITRSLKRTAMAVGVPIVLLSQLNREVEKRADQRPRLADLRESGAIEQDSDVVLLLHRPGSYQGERTDSKGNPLPPIADDHGILHVAKNRNGPTGEVKLVWHAPTMRYSADVTDPFGGRF